MIVKEQRPQDMRGIPIFDTVLIECRDIQMNLFWTLPMDRDSFTIKAGRTGVAQAAVRIKRERRVTISRSGNIHLQVLIMI